MRKRVLGCAVILVASILGLPSATVACERCITYRICMADDCWWTQICGITSSPVAGWSECDDTSYPCTIGGTKCLWVSTPELRDETPPNANPAGA